ncbi:MAG: hypothetical protein ACTSUV_04015 [Candidatus Ranarchaeia archaeon]
MNKEKIISEFFESCFVLDDLIKTKFGKDSFVVDSYFGNLPKPKKSFSLDILIDKFETLIRNIDSVDNDFERIYLEKQLTGLLTQAQLLSGLDFSYFDQIERMLDVTPEKISEKTIQKLKTNVEKYLQDKGSKDDPVEEIRRWKKEREIPSEKLMEKMNQTANFVRKLTKEKIIDLPKGEETLFKPVKDAPWGAYHYYKKGYKSLVEINTKFPILEPSLIAWISHETYPGHQTQLSRREMLYNKGVFGIEGTLSLINVPDCTITEGGAECGILFLNLVKNEDQEFLGMIEKLGREVGKAAAFKLNEEKKDHQEVVEYIAENNFLDIERAKSRIPFMVDPIWRTYIYTYSEGKDLVSKLYNKAKSIEKEKEFFQILYSELHVPTSLEKRINQILS